MAYNKNTWHRGDVVSSSGLNNMEDGIAANDAAISEIHDPAKSAIAEGGIGYYDKTTLLNETIPVADWVDEAQDAYAEIDVTGIELSADKKYWIVIDGVATKCDYGEVDDEWFIVPIDPETPFPAIGTNISGNYSLYLAELPTEPVSFQLIEGEAQKISNDFLQPSGGGWDACIEFDVLYPENPSAQFVFGSHDTLMEKVNAGILPMVCFKSSQGGLISNIYSVEKDFDDPNVLLINFNYSSVDNFMQFAIKADNSIDVSL